MEHSQKSIIFEIQHYLDFGQAIYVCGEPMELGKWNLQKAIRLSCEKDGIWTAVVKINSKIESFEYKYMIDKYDRDINSQSVWENGINRKIVLRNDHQESYKTNDFWNMRNVTVMVKKVNDKQINSQFKNNSDNFQQLFIIGNLDQLKTPQLLKETKIKNKIVYIYNILIPLQHQKFRFNLALVNKDEISSPYLKWDNNVQKIDFVKDNLSNLIYKCEIQKIISPFQFNYIDEFVCVGPCPRSPNAIKMLNQQGIKAVINVQTVQEIQIRGQNLDGLEQLYQQNGIEFIHYPIIDMDVFDMSCKLYDVVQIIQKYFNKGQKVYVHCSRGQYRSPFIVQAFYKSRNKSCDKTRKEYLEAKFNQSLKYRTYSERIFDIFHN